MLPNPATIAAAPSSVETLNHFEQILPKDDFEIKKQKEESAENVNKGNKKDAKKGECLSEFFFQICFFFILR